MDTTLYGYLAKPVVALIGTWDPILPDHMALAHRLIQHAHQNDRAALLVMLSPSPATFILQKAYPEAAWITYNELETNINCFLNAGADGVLHIHFKPEYLAMGAAELCDTICAHAELAELWFGAMQTFGRTGGSQQALIKLAKERGIRLRRLALAQTNTNKLSAQIRHFLAHGQLAQAVQYAHYPLVRKKPSCGEVSEPWPPGKYRALPITRLTEINHIRADGNQTVECTFHNDGQRVSKFRWPNPEIEYLLFVAGPHDSSAATAVC